MRTHLTVLAALAVCAPVEGQSPSRSVNVEARRTTSLKGTWRAKPKDQSDRIEYDRDTNQVLSAVLSPSPYSIISYIIAEQCWAAAQACRPVMVDGATRNAAGFPRRPTR